MLNELPMYYTFPGARLVPPPTRLSGPPPLIFSLAPPRAIRLRTILPEVVRFSLNTTVQLLALSTSFFPLQLFVIFELQGEPRTRGERFVPFLDPSFFSRPFHGGSLFPALQGSWALLCFLHLFRPDSFLFQDVPPSREDTLRI